ncbi:MAG: lactate utilization protein [Lachnospiraceae bacterium]|nr:lactate utilization protein [Lachnospiraceae bacterium]
MTPVQTYYETLACSIIKKLEKRGMEGYYCPDSKSAVEMALSMMPEGSTITWGGSVTIAETGLVAALDPDRYHILDREKAKTPEERKECYRQAFGADYFLMSTNAITKDGELVNIDGTGNRVAALSYGPEHILMMVGMNKVEPDLQAAIKRVHNTAAPANAIRIGMNTPCSKTGSCADCLSPDCICAHTLITRFNRFPGRIKVILIGETLGY